MSDDQRSQAASSLRVFFDEQINHLQTLWDSLGGPDDEAQASERDRQIIEDFVDSANCKMRAVSGYADKLRGHVRPLYQHVLQVAARIPPPVDVSGDCFGCTPIVNALFVNSHDIDRLFQTEREVRAYLRSHSEYQVPVIYALLNAQMSEKTLLGVGMLGEVMVREVSRRAVNFSAHKIRMPCASSEELSEALKQYLFEHVVDLVRQKMAARMADQAFALSKKPYQDHVDSLANPDVYLNALLECIESPAKLLNIDQAHFRLNKLGIKIDDDDMQRANEFDIHELIWSDGTRNVVMQIAYKRLQSA